ncbi:MAG: hypothetical protein PHH61_01910 [Candidatus Nanoarchaeia archaeon]|nr:hypothetical protein [Candidatus Paceibacterota bacterium]MDD5239196.1 hypothetical protein [Candidatus Nanoarchaeia archaeon]
MNKKASDDSGTTKFLPEILLGTVVCLMIVFGFVTAVSAVSSNTLDIANQKSLSVLVPAMAQAMNFQTSGGENTVSLWRMAGYSDFVYSIIFVPAKSAESIIKADRGSDSFISRIDLQSADQLAKCAQPDEACLCLFKLEYSSKDNIPDYNVIVLGDPEPQPEDRYAAELQKAEEWLATQMSSVTVSYIKNTKIVSCEPLLNNGCFYLESDGASKACIPHYNSKPMVWLSASSEEYLDFETILISVESYATMNSHGLFPQLEFSALKGVEYPETQITYGAGSLIYKE